VAYNTALKARRLAFRRRAREIQVDKMPEREVIEPRPTRRSLVADLARLPATAT
jgi:hypothetical protein